MSIFHRKQTGPVDPPAGYKWVFSASIMGRNGEPCTEIVLVREDLQIEYDDRGYARWPHPGNESFAKGAMMPIVTAGPHEYFVYSREIRRASIKILNDRFEAEARGRWLKDLQQR